MEDEFRRRVFGEIAEQVVDWRGEVGDEAAWARAGKAEIAPSDEEVERCNLDHAVFRSWCPRCMEGRLESRAGRKCSTDG